MIKKITSFTQHTTAEGERISFTYSIIDNGIVTKSNERLTCIVTPDEESVINAIKTINEFLEKRIPE